MSATIDSPLLIRDPYGREKFRRERIADGQDRYDEVWDGAYIALPQPDDGHQEIVTCLATILGSLFQFKALGKVRAGTNVSDRSRHWTENYRCPDVAVMLNSGSAENRGTYWLRGPDFVVEVVSPDDGVHEKIPFYSQVGVRELLIVDRQPWRLELWRHNANELASQGTATVENAAWLTAEVVGLRLRLVEGTTRPTIEVQTVDGAQNWRI